MSAMLDEPLELLDEDLDAVSGGDAVFNFNNFVPNQGVQVSIIGAVNNFESNQGVQVAVNFG